MLFDRRRSSTAHQTLLVSAFLQFSAFGPVLRHGRRKVNGNPTCTGKRKGEQVVRLVFRANVRDTLDDFIARRQKLTDCRQPRVVVFFGCRPDLGSKKTFPFFKVRWAAFLVRLDTKHVLGFIYEKLSFGSGSASGLPGNQHLLRSRFYPSPASGHRRSQAEKN